MEPNKFKSVKEQLQNRTITPSAASWDKLSVLLDQQEAVAVVQKKKQFGVYWSSIAAVLLISFGLGVYFNHNQDTQIALPKTPATSTAKHQEQTEAVKQEQEIATAVPAQVAVVFTPQKTNSKPQKTKEIVRFSPIVDHFNEDTKAHQSVVVVENTANELSNSEASFKLNIQLKSPKNKIAVDSKKLLQATENVIESEYRDQKLNTFKNHFNAVKVAIVERNRE